MLSFLLYQFVLYCNDNLSLLFVYYLNRLMDSHVIQWIISHHHHIYFDAWIVPDLATGSFCKRVPLRTNLTCFAGVKNKTWGSVETGFPRVFLCEWTRLRGVRKNKAMSETRARPGYWTDLTWQNPFSRTSLFSYLELRVQIISIHIRGALVYLLNFALQSKTTLILSPLQKVTHSALNRRENLDHVSLFRDWRWGPEGQR